MSSRVMRMGAEDQVARQRNRCERNPRYQRIRIDRGECRACAMQLPRQALSLRTDDGPCAAEQVRRSGGPKGESSGQTALRLTAAGSIKRSVPVGPSSSKTLLLWNVNVHRR